MTVHRTLIAGLALVAASSSTLAQGTQPASRPASRPASQPSSRPASRPAMAAKADASAQPANPNLPEKFRARVLRWGGGAATGTTATLHIHIDGWTTLAERNELQGLLRSGGSAAMMKRFGEMRKGWVRYSDDLRWHLSSASSTQTQMGRVIRLATERPIRLGEAKYQTRSLDYELGVIEFLLDDAGEGTGSLIPAAQITIDEQGQIEIEHMGLKPHKLTSVRKTN